MACIASVSAQVRGASCDERKKNKEMRGEGEGSEGNACRKPHDFEKLRSPTNAASDWCSAGSVN